jgi:hypothetical protein
MGMFDDSQQFAVVPVPGTYGCPQAGKGNFVLDTSAEVAGLTFGSTNKRVPTADGRATPTPRDARQVCSTLNTSYRHPTWLPTQQRHYTFGQGIQRLVGAQS